MVNNVINLEYMFIYIIWDYWIMYIFFSTSQNTKKADINQSSVFIYKSFIKNFRKNL